MTTADRFWKKVNKNGPIPSHRPELGSCWLWTGATLAAGYGTFLYEGTSQLAHRVAWILSSGRIPEAHDICHKCDNTTCVRPSHLFPGTRKQNMEDMRAKGRYGHPCVLGENNGASKLKATNVEEIRARHNAGETATHLAQIFTVSASTIRRIVRGTLWPQEPDDFFTRRFRRVS